MISQAHKSQLVIEIVKRVVKTLEKYEYSSDKHYVLNADLIPKVSNGLKTHKDLHPSIHTPEKKKPIEHRYKKHTSLIPRKHPHKPVKEPMPLQSHEHKVAPSPSLKKATLDELYGGRLKGLINDPSVSSIECLGPNIPINIFRHSQKMRTKITLTKIDIEKLLEEVSRESKIPLSDGVFRVIVNNLMINAVISEVVGTKFLIKKLFPLEYQRH